MGDKDLYVGDVRNYYNLKHILSSTNNLPELKVCSSSSIHDGKTQRRERRAKTIRRRKGRL